MKKIKFFSIILIMVFLPITTNVFARQSKGMTVLKAYLKALERLQFKKAYRYVIPEDKKYKKLKEFIDENPIPLIKALRLINKKFFKFKIVNEKKTKLDNIILKTIDLDFPDPNFTYGMLYNMIKFKSMRKKKGRKALNPKKPRDVLKAIKAISKKSKKKLPFKQVEKKIKVVKVKNKWYVNPGWKAKVIAKREKAKAEAMKRKKGQAEWHARSTIDRAKRSSNPSEYKKAIDKLRKLQKDAPESKLIKDGLTLLTKRLTKYNENIKKVKIRFLKKENIMPSTWMRLEIRNESKLKVESFQIEYSLYDNKGKLLRNEVNVQIFSCDSLDPPAFEGCQPGYVGKLSLSINEPANWTKAKVKFTRVTFFFLE